MKKVRRKIFYIDCPLLTREENNLLILESKRKKVFNPVFTIGVICFIGSMFFKANNDADIAAIPLAISTVILLSGVWILSEAGKVVFDKTEGKIYCIYNHLGYLQKIYVHSIKAVDAINLQGHVLILEKDNGEEVLISKEKSVGTQTLITLKEKLRLFFNLEIK